ncbi:hypothetical protein NEMBOFW57_008004 [Staphylotrichum longicolle]|uniref:histidinol-phosphate transaminase n=1 Tax=Staphylotrichum longicolle TaxID=669026 RepID=A0AAD4EQW0_9PEZI|nr:hypothetical protein NEMBOFW57_008004 [Staphylotrichum longicolle]
MMLADLNENALGPSIASGSCLEVGQGATLSEIGLIHVPEESCEGLSRYPDLHQIELKQAFCDFRNVRDGAALTPANLCCSTGLDDIIDLLVRSLCRPGHDQIVICPPVYHMYQTTATINDVETISIPLNTQNNFQLRLTALQQALCSDPNIKICFVCTPGNPTGHAISFEDIKAVLDNPGWRGILVVDEAYIDFSPRSPSAVRLVNQYPRLVVLQTLSKAFGLASIRVGFAVACAHLSAILNNVRKPYAISGPSIALAKAALTKPSLAILDAKLMSIFEERSRLARELGRIQGIRVRGGLDANFVLFEVCGTTSEFSFSTTSSIAVAPINQFPQPSAVITPSG